MADESKKTKKTDSKKTVDKKVTEKAKTESVKHTICETTQQMMKKAAKDFDLF